MPCSLLRVLIGIRNFKTDEKKKWFIRGNYLTFAQLDDKYLSFMA